MHQQAAATTSSVSDIQVPRIDVLERFDKGVFIEGVLLRPSEPVAARNQREYERPVEAVPPQGHRCLDLLTAQTQCVGPEVERATQEDSRLPDPG